MKLLKFSVTALLALGMAFLGGCSDDDGIDNRDQDYGYVQFKLHKEASYDALSRAQKPQLDYLSEASKVQVSLYYDGTTITHYSKLIFSYNFVFTQISSIGISN